MKRAFFIVMSLLLFISAVQAQDAKTPADICAAAVPAKDPETRQFSAAEQVLQPNTDYRAVFCTEAGPIYVDLFEEYAPVTVNNFVFLAQKGFYNNTTFHRVIQDFMAQGGDPTGTGTGGPGYQFKDEFVGFLNFDVPGWLAMANANQPEQGIVGTNGSQFFITTVPTQHLDFRHTIFGQVLEGQDNVAKIRLRDPDTDKEPGTKLNTVVIITDPSTVKTTFEEKPVATEDEVVKALDEGVKKLITPDVESLVSSSTTSLTPDQAADAAGDAKADAAALYQKYNLQYRVTNTFTNKACDLQQIPYTSLGYTLDAFDNRADASAALADEAFGKLLEAQGYTAKKSDNLAYPLYTLKTKECNQDVTRAVTYWQRGHYIATAQVSIPADAQFADRLDLILSQFVGVQFYEPLLSDVLRREIRPPASSGS
jgi:cyclophilin family peptidyl-prolyl cis-trans isomerase